MRFITMIFTIGALVGLLVGPAQAASCGQTDQKLRADCLDKRVSELERLSSMAKVDLQKIRDAFKPTATSGDDCSLCQ
jgi:hypothetical protein